jgi:tetratricopeptide (TPR) repeat protein
MIFIKKLSWSIVLIFSFNTLLFAQNIETTLSLADTLKSRNQYDLATKLYTRVLFFDTTENKSNLYKNIADCYFNQSDYEKAEKFYTYASYSAKDTQFYSLILNKVSAQIMQKKFKPALQTIFALPDSLEGDIDKQRKLYLATIYFGLEDFENSKMIFLTLIPDTAIKAKNRIKVIFEQKRNLYRPNPNTVYYLSSVIPGSGQLLYGDYKNSLNSLLLTGALGAVTYYTAMNYSAIDAFLSAFPWFFRYYQGGAANAEEKAINERNRKRDFYYQEVLDIISSYY